MVAPQQHGASQHVLELADVGCADVQVNVGVGVVGSRYVIS